MKFKTQKGSISLLVLITVLFYSSFLLLLYSKNLNKTTTLVEKVRNMKTAYINSTLEDAYEQILNKKLIKNSNGNSSNIDKWVWTIAFIYDLNFEYSFQEIKKRNYIENLINRIDYKDEQTKQRMEKIKK